MINVVPEAYVPRDRRLFLILQGVSAASTVRASRFGDAIASVFPSEEERAGFGRERENGEMWNESNNQRRCDLIDLKYSRGLTAAETKELTRLQALLVHHRERVAPLPIEAAQRFYDELLARIASTQTTGQ